jgi:heme oxygenase
LRARTAPLHREAERSGIIHDLLTGRAQRDSLVLLLQNLLCVYQALETGLMAHKGSALLGELCRPELYRAPAIATDVEALGGTDELLPEALCYAERVTQSAEGDGTRLLAFAYVRYMGDLSGGQILNRLLCRSFSLTNLAFYSFPKIPDLQEFRQNYRAALDRAGAKLPDPAPVVDTALQAFRLDIDLSVAVARRAQETSPG